MSVDEWMKAMNIAAYGSHLDPIIKLAWKAATQAALEERLKEPPTFKLDQFLTLFHQWSMETFGPGPRTAGVLKHIRKELDEITAKPDDVMEWIDVALLTFNGAMRRGFTAEILCMAFEYKLAENRARVWPPPGPDDEVTEHVRAIPALGNMHPADARDIRDLRPAPTTPLQAAVIFGTVVYAQGRCDYVDSLFGQCVLGANHQGVHVMKEDQ